MGSFTLSSNINTLFILVFKQDLVLRVPWGDLLEEWLSQVQVSILNGSALDRYLHSGFEQRQF